MNASPRQLSDTEQFLSVVDSMRDPDARPGLAADLLSHVQFSTLTAGEDIYLMQFMGYCSGMETVLRESPKGRGVWWLISSGTLYQWKQAVARGCEQDVEPPVRAGFNEVHSIFVAEGLGALWSDYRQEDSNDVASTYLLAWNGR